MPRPKPQFWVAFLSIALWHWMVITCCAQQATLRILNDVAAKFESAHDALKRGDFEIAEQAFAEIASMGDDQVLENEQKLIARARYWLAEAQLNRHQFRQARKNYRRYLDDAPSGYFTPWASLRMGQTANRLGEYAAAERAFRTFLKRYSDHPQAATAYAELPDILYRIALQDLRAWKEYGDCEGIDAAFERLATHVRVFPKDKKHGQVCYHLGQVLLQKKNYEQAKTTFLDCLDTISESDTEPGQPELLPLAHYYLADALKQLGDTRAAEKHFQIVVDGWPNQSVAGSATQQLAQIRPQPIDRSIQLAKAQIRKNDVDGAIQTLIRGQDAFAKTDREHEFHDLLAQCLSNRGDFAGARGHWNQVVRSTYAAPRLAANALGRIAQSHRQQGNYQAAIREYLRLASSFESDTFSRQYAFEAAADCYEQLGDHRSATRISIAASAERSEPSPSDLTAQLGNRISQK